MAKSSEMGNLLQREKLLLFSGLALITILAWAYMLHMAWEMVGKGMDINSRFAWAIGGQEISHTCSSCGR